MSLFKNLKDKIKHKDDDDYYDDGSDGEYSDVETYTLDAGGEDGTEY